MFGIYSDEYCLRLQAEGFVPYSLGIVFEGDQFVWDAPVRYGTRDDGTTIIDDKPRIYSVLRLEAKCADYSDEGGVFHANTILHMTVRDQNGLLSRLTISTSHDTWVRQCEANKKLFGDIAEEVFNNAAKSLEEHPNFEF